MVSRVVIVALCFIAYVLGNLHWLFHIQPPNESTYLIAPFFLFVLFTNNLPQYFNVIFGILTLIGLVGMARLIFLQYQCRWFLPVGFLILGILHGELSIWILEGLVG